MSIDVLNRLLVASEWAEQVSNRGGIPSRVREAAQGQSYSITKACAAVAELIEASGALLVLGDGRGYFESGDDCQRFRAALAACKESSHG